MAKDLGCAALEDTDERDLVAAWGARRWDSARRRRSSRSCFRREGASSGRVVVFEDGFGDSGFVVLRVWSGGRDDWVG